MGMAEDKVEKVAPSVVGREETGLEAWQREMREGVPFRESVRRGWGTARWYILAWVFVLVTNPYMASYYGLLFVLGFDTVFFLATVGRYAQYRARRAHFNQLMGVVAAMHGKGANE